jgi:ADP-ribosylglycohydrolase
VGLINAGNPEQASLDAYDVVSLMHWGHSRDAAGIIAAATAEAFNPNATVDSVVKAALDNIPGGKQSRMYEPMQLAVKLAREAKDTEELTKLYYDQLIVEWSGRGMKVSTDGRHCNSCEALESIPCVIGMFLNAKGDFKKAVVGAANFGRDCDTIACMTGYIAGAFNGIDAIPPQWVDAVLKANPDPNLTDLAEKLYETLIRQNEKDLARTNAILGMK